MLAVGKVSRFALFGVLGLLLFGAGFVLSRSALGQTLSERLTLAGCRAERAADALRPERAQPSADKEIFFVSCGGIY